MQAEASARRIDLLLSAYLVASALLIAGSRNALPGWGYFVAAHMVLASAASCLYRLPAALPAVARFFRYWYPMISFPLLYKEVECLARVLGNWKLTGVLQEFEVSLFGGHPSLFLSQRFPWLPLSEYLHFCYLAYIVLVPAAAGYWYFRGRMQPFAELLLLITVIYLSSCFFYLLFPVDSPYYLFPELAPPLSGGLFYRLVHFISAHGGARGGAFPSLHVSITTAAWVVLLRWERKAAWRIAPMVAGLVLATVYCRFHYVLDAVAGAALALFTASVILGRSDLLTRGRAASYKGFAGSGLHP